MAQRKYKNKTIPRGITIDRGYVFIRIFTNGQLFRQSVGSISEPDILNLAIAKLNQYREQIRLGKFGLEEKQRRLMMEQACDVYWKLHGSKKKAAQSYRIYLRYIGDFFKGRYVDTITYIDVQNYRREREKKVKPSTVNKEHTAITNLFYKLREWRRLGVIHKVRLPEENPGSLVHKANEKEYTRKRVLAPAEFDSLMKCANICVRRAVLMAVNTSLRLKDLKALTIDSINRTTNQLEGVQAKTGKPYAVPINPVIQQLIESAPGNHLLDFTNFRRDFEKAKRAAGLKDFQFRDLRRTGARTMLKEGVDLATVSGYLGHTSLRMTESYVSSSKDDIKKAGDVLGDLFKWPPEASRSKLS